jgi:hypothetical protein
VGALLLAAAQLQTLEHGEHQELVSSSVTLSANQVPGKSVHARLDLQLQQQLLSPAGDASPWRSVCKGARLFM